MMCTTLPSLSPTKKCVYITIKATSTNNETSAVYPVAAKKSQLLYQISLFKTSYGWYTSDTTFICNTKQQLIKGNNTIQNDIRYVKQGYRLQMVHSCDTVHRLYQYVPYCQVTTQFHCWNCTFFFRPLFKCYFLLTKAHSIFLVGFFQFRK